jgi:hypothetical protein
MKTVSLTLAFLLSIARLASAQASDVSLADAKPLPSIDFLLQQAIARAASMENKNDNLFDMNYQYNRVQTWEYRNRSGELKSHKEKHSVENKPLRLAAKGIELATLNKPALTDEPALNKFKDYSIPNLAKRFQFTLAGREMLNGRPSLMVDFKPASDHLPVNSFAENFVNKTAGRIWVDEEDFAIAQAKLHLAEQVNVLGGIVGPVSKFTFELTRLRTPEGFWFARNMDWHVEGREVVVNRIIDYHERQLNEQKIVGTTITR